ncbi:MAG: hypothetical protein IB616_01725 [Methanosarcinales archaeon]|nr:MAG: hypothetical protein IB616_01725 [Methanosarcinales archaeon]
MKLKWWIILDALVFYTPIPFLILFGQKEFAIWSAWSGTSLIIGILLLYTTGIREMSLNPLKHLGENPKASLIGIAIIVASALIFNFLKTYP